MEMNALEVIRNVALECLLQDQICDRTPDNSYYGSWGRSTLDYCYLTTEEERWTPGCGSITQTAWALLGLRGLKDLTPAESLRLESAASRSDRYVTNYIESFLSSPERDRTKAAKNRHAATALLADLILADICPARRQRKTPRLDIFEKYTRLLTDLGRYLEEECSEMRASPSAEAALVALYPLLVRTLLLLPEKNPLNEEGGTLHALVDVWQEHAVDVVTSATYLLARFDPKTSPIISRPHVWAALLDAMSIVAEEEDEVGMVTRTLLSEVKHDAEIGVAMIADSPLPVVRSGSLWEPWGTLSVLVQLGAKHTGLATHVAEGIVQALETKSIIKPRLPIIGGCTHIWSILVRRSVPMAAVQKEAKKKELVQRVAPLVTAQEFVPAAKFDYIHWPRGEKERIARDVRAFEVHQAWIRGGERGNPSIPSRFAALYRGDPASELGLTRNSNSRCQSLLLSGYSTSGKSKAAEFLEHHAGLGRMVMRVVAGATWELGESWEKPYYNEVTEAFFNEQKNELFGVHQLRGARFGFSTQDYNDIPESLIRILPVGWSQKAIVDVDKFCQSRGDESVLVAFRPSESILEQRIRKRWVGEDVPRHLNKAKEFYRCLPEKAIVIDSSGPEEEMFCELFRQLQGVLTYGEGYDVAVSYAGTRDQIAVAEEIKSALRTVGITAFVACQDTAPNRKPTAQGNIDLVFELADVIVVIWSEDYPMREFSRYEWTQWVIDKWKKNDNGVVFVDFDGSRMPPGFHEAASIKWEPSQATAVACAVKNRLRLINRS